MSWKINHHQVKATLGLVFILPQVMTNFKVILEQTGLINAGILCKGFTQNMKGLLLTVQRK